MKRRDTGTECRRVDVGVVVVRSWLKVGSSLVRYLLMVVQKGLFQVGWFVVGCEWV